MGLEIVYIYFHGWKSRMGYQNVVVAYSVPISFAKPHTKRDVKAKEDELQGRFVRDSVE
jgi:hypothetical protein